MVLQDGSGHKAGRTVADTAKLDSCGHNGIVRPSPRRGPSAESVQVEPWVVQFANVRDWHGEAAAGTGRGGTSGGTAVLVRRHVDHRPGAVFQGLFAPQAVGLGVL